MRPAVQALWEQLYGATTLAVQRRQAGMMIEEGSGLPLPVVVGQEHYSDRGENQVPSTGHIHAPQEVENYSQVP